MLIGFSKNHFFDYWFCAHDGCPIYFFTLKILIDAGRIPVLWPARNVFKQNFRALSLLNFPTNTVSKAPDCLVNLEIGRSLSMPIFLNFSFTKDITDRYLL